MKIQKPTLLLDKQKCRQNIRRMADKARKNQLIFRPHFKTHQSLEIGRWFKEYGVDKITVSSVSMAEYFAEEWDDITIAFPLNILEIDRVNLLAEQINLNVLVESMDSSRFLVENLCSKLGCFLKIDAGYHRTGILCEDRSTIDTILSLLEASELLKFKGFLVHNGHSYQARSKQEILETHHKSFKHLLSLKRHFQEQYPDLILSLGDTPSCSVLEKFEGIDEIRPGNFVFYDLMQMQIGSNGPEQIAVAMACPIVAKHPQRNEIVIYGGGVHFSKDQMKGKDGGTVFGQVVEKSGSAWTHPIPGMYLQKLSQEHGIIHVPVGLIDRYQIGDLLYILPVHSCMTADLMRAYTCLDGTTVYCDPQSK